MGLLVIWFHFILPIFIFSKIQLITKVPLWSLADKQEAAAKSVKAAFRILYDSFSWLFIFPFQVHLVCLKLCLREFLENWS